jgi:hypothetical protein
MTAGANDSDGIVAGTVIGGQAQTQEERLTVVVRTRPDRRRQQGGG